MIAASTAIPVDIKAKTPTTGESHAASGAKGASHDSDRSFAAHLSEQEQDSETGAPRTSGEKTAGSETRGEAKPLRKTQSTPATAQESVPAAPAMAPETSSAQVAAIAIAQLVPATGAPVHAEPAAAPVAGESIATTAAPDAKPTAVANTMPAAASTMPVTKAEATAPGAAGETPGAQASAPNGAKPPMPDDAGSRTALQNLAAAPEAAPKTKTGEPQQATPAKPAELSMPAQAKVAEPQQAVPVKPIAPVEPQPTAKPALSPTTSEPQTPAAQARAENAPASSAGHRQDANTNANTQGGQQHAQQAQSQPQAHSHSQAAAQASAAPGAPVQVDGAPQPDANPIRVPDAAMALQTQPRDAAPDGVVRINVTAPAQSDARTADIEGLALRIAARSMEGAKRFDIRLDPPELGRIEVRLEVAEGGRSHAQLSADRPQTLELLQRDARMLERALRDAGLDLGGGLSFSLKGGERQAQEHSTPDSSRYRPLAIGAVETDEAMAMAGLDQWHSLSGGQPRLDIRI